MNKRIRELAEQAFFDETIVQPRHRYIRISDHKMQQFAELIVQECIRVCDKQVAIAVGTYASAHNSAVGSCVNGIKEHFGVEE